MTRRSLTGLLIQGLLLPMGLPLGSVGVQAVELPPLPAIAPATAAPASSPRTLPAPATAAVTSNRQILLELGRRTISLVEDGKVLGSWPVAIGDSATPTPTGTFAVRNKVINPQYQSTKSGKVNPTVGAQGPLGDRWIGFHATAKDQFGIHGTPSAWAWTVTSRAAVTHGCVRMLTPHVRQLFEKVQVGTPMIVRR
jgi:lipoprotein-anchoring transpeptidase ErfK/SrfK